MNIAERENRLHNFEKSLQEWGARPPITPPGVARTRVLADVPETAVRWPWLRLAAAAVMLVVLGVSVWHGSPRPAGETGPSAELNAPPALDRNIVVWRLDDRTTVYFALSPGRAGKGGVS